MSDPATTGPDQGMPEVSVVVPVFGHVDQLRPLCDRIAASVGPGPIEIVLVDDAGPAPSGDAVRRLATDMPWVRALHLRERAGGIGARAAGAATARAPIVVTIDADLEYAPEDIGGLVAAVRSGSDLVSGVRRDQVGRSATRRLASPLIRHLGRPSLGIAPTDFGCGLKAWRADLGAQALAWEGPGGELRFAIALHRLAQHYTEVPVSWQRGAHPSTYSGRARLRLALHLLAAARPTGHRAPRRGRPPITAPSP